ncbi:DNA polymerase III subunit epsilon [Shewanella oncorhynchi]|uniref:DNA polymerase III subunit epsilon n=1 Tax=Shewanella oncorhynchi TaxID=2726434 RepID=UPI003D790FEC
MSKLNAAERKARDNARFSQRVDERRTKGEDVVAYVLGNKLAFKFLTKPERHEFKQREAALEEEAKLKKQQAFQLKTEQELEKVEAAFTNTEE